MNKYFPLIIGLFHDFGTEFIVTEPTEAKSLILDYIKHFQNLEENYDIEASEIYEFCFEIAKGVEWRKKEFNE